MSKIVEIGQNPKGKALAIIDDSPLDHAEWHNTKESAAASMRPLNSLLLEWEEMFSMGVSDNRYVAYGERLPATINCMSRKFQFFWRADRQGSDIGGPGSAALLEKSMVLADTDHGHRRGFCS